MFCEDLSVIACVNQFLLQIYRRQVEKQKQFFGFKFFTKTFTKFFTKYSYSKDIFTRKKPKSKEKNSKWKVKIRVKGKFPAENVCL